MIALIGGHSVDDAVGTDFVGIVSQNGHAGVGFGIDPAGRVSQVLPAECIQQRHHGGHHAGDDRFIDLARSVYKTNDGRAEVKRQINRLLDSELVEEKSYESY